MHEPSREDTDERRRPPSERQRRVVEYLRLLGGTVLALDGFMLAMQAVGLFPGTVGPLAGLLALLGLALVLGAIVVGHRTRGRHVVIAVDAAATSLATTLLVLAANMAPNTAPDGVDSMLLTLVIVLRVAMVPSTPGRTLALGLGATALSAGASLVVDRIRADALGTLVPFLVFGTLLALVTFKAAKVISGLEARVERAARLGPYELVERIGRGGMGVVWSARHTMLDRLTAIKVMARDRRRDDDIARFEKEVRLMSGLSHPNILPVFDYGQTDDGELYYAMELVDGLSLQDLVQWSGPLPLPRAVHLLHQVADGLAHAHSAGLIHRDVKPANILVSGREGTRDVVKVFDFGLVQLLARPDTERESTVPGTVEYLAPEAVLTPGEVDARLDVYAFGVVAYYVLTARTPFEGADFVTICRQHVHATPPSLRDAQPELPAALADLVEQCLAKDRDARPPGAAAVARTLRQLAEHHPWSGDDSTAFWTDYYAARRELPELRPAIAASSLNDVRRPRASS